MTFEPARTWAVIRALLLGVPGALLLLWGVATLEPLWMLLCCPPGWLMVAGAARQLHLLKDPPVLELDGTLLHYRVPDWGLGGLLRPWQVYEEGVIDCDRLATLRLETTDNMFGPQGTLVLVQRVEPDPEPLPEGLTPELEGILQNIRDLRGLLPFGPTLRIEYNWFATELADIQAAILDAVDAAHAEPLRELVGVADFNSRRFAEPVLIPSLARTQYWRGIVVVLGIGGVLLSQTAEPAFLVMGGLVAFVLVLLLYLNISEIRRGRVSRLRLSAEGIQLGREPVEAPVIPWTDVRNVRAQRVSTSSNGVSGSASTAQLMVHLHDGRIFALHNDYDVPLDDLLALLQPDPFVVEHTFRLTDAGLTLEEAALQAGLPARPAG